MPEGGAITVELRPRIGRPPSDRVCSIPDCGGRHEARGLCYPHYKRLLRHGDPLAGRKQVGTVIPCSIEGCNKPVQSRGWCEAHYSAWRRNGSPETVRKTKPWSPEEDAFLRRCHHRMTLQKIAEALGRSQGSLRARITRLGWAKKRLWTQEEEAKLIDLYTKAGVDGVLRLEELARRMGRDAGNVSRKAKILGLPTSPSRRIRFDHELKIKVPKFATDDERRQARSETSKKWHQENEHPRGMKGKQHTDATRRRLSETSKAASLFMTEEERAERALRALKMRAAKRQGSTAPRVQRGSWKAGWREIGGKNNYYRSRWEANYARYLQWLKERGEISDWQYEPETFWFDPIKRGVRSYCPDFRVWENDRTSALHEVKGWMDQRSRTTLKRMAKYHPHERIILIDGQQYRAIRLKVMRLVPDWEDHKRDSHA